MYNSCVHTATVMFISETDAPTSELYPSESPSAKNTDIPTEMPTATTTECPQNETFGYVDAEHLSVWIRIGCVERRVSIGIEYKATNDVWFGLVFNEKMEGDALVFSTGKNGRRTAALYYYRIAYPWINEDVTKDWTRVSHSEEDGALRIEYVTDIDRTPWTTKTSLIRFRYAIGLSMELQKHAFHSAETYALRMSGTQSPQSTLTAQPTLRRTRAPTDVPTAIPTAVSVPTADALDESNGGKQTADLTVLIVVSIFGLIGIFLFVGILYLLRRTDAEKYDLVT